MSNLIFVKDENKVSQEMPGWLNTSEIAAAGRKELGTLKKFATKADKKIENIVTHYGCNCGKRYSKDHPAFSSQINLAKVAGKDSVDLTCPACGGKVYALESINRVRYNNTMGSKYADEYVVIGKDQNLSKEASGTYNTFIDRHVVLRALNALQGYASKNGMCMARARYIKGTHTKEAGFDFPIITKVSAEIAWVYGRKQTRTVTAEIGINAAGDFIYPKVFTTAEHKEYPFVKEAVKQVENTVSPREFVDNRRKTDTPTYRKPDPTRFRMASLNVDEMNPKDDKDKDDDKDEDKHEDKHDIIASLISKATFGDSVESLEEKTLNDPDKHTTYLDIVTRHCDGVDPDCELSIKDAVDKMSGDQKQSLKEELQTVDPSFDYMISEASIQKNAFDDVVDSIVNEYADGSRQVGDIEVNEPESVSVGINDGEGIDVVAGLKTALQNERLHKETDKDGTVSYYNENDQLHRVDGPAVEHPDGTKRWYINGLLHRTDGPAFEQPNGYKAWYLNGKRHREDGPAMEEDNGDNYWFQNDQFHRLDGPAVEETDGTKKWYQNNKKHRTGGPAVIYPDGSEEWYIDDKLFGKSKDGYTQEQFEKDLKGNNKTASPILSTEENMMIHHGKDILRYLDALKKATVSLKSGELTEDKVTNVLKYSIEGVFDVEVPKYLESWLMNPPRINEVINAGINIQNKYGTEAAMIVHALYEFVEGLGLLSYDDDGDDDGDGDGDQFHLN